MAAVMNGLRSVVFLALLLAVAAYTQRGSAAYGIYQPPAGWHRTENLAPGLGVWVHPSDNQSISVQATHFGGSLADFAAVQATQIRALPLSKIGVMQRTSVCGGHAAMYISYEATVNNEELVYEQMLTVWSGVGYLASYARASGQPSHEAARRSLTTLCGGYVAPVAPGARTPVPVNVPVTSTPYLGPSQAPQTYGPAAPTVTPTGGM